LLIGFSLTKCWWNS